MPYKTTRQKIKDTAKGLAGFVFAIAGTLFTGLMAFVGMMEFSSALWLSGMAFLFGVAIEETVNTKGASESVERLTTSHYLASNIVKRQLEKFRKQRWLIVEKNAAEKSISATNTAAIEPDQAKLESNTFLELYSKQYDEVVHLTRKLNKFQLMQGLPGIAQKINRFFGGSEDYQTAKAELEKAQQRLNWMVAACVHKLKIDDKAPESTVAVYRETEIEISIMHLFAGKDAALKQEVSAKKSIINGLFYLCMLAGVVTGFALYTNLKEALLRLNYVLGWQWILTGAIFAGIGTALLLYQASTKMVDKREISPPSDTSDSELTFTQKYLTTRNVCFALLGIVGTWASIAYSASVYADAARMSFLSSVGFGWLTIVISVVAIGVVLVPNLIFNLSNSAGTVDSILNDAYALQSVKIPADQDVPTYLHFIGMPCIAKHGDTSDYYVWGSNDEGVWLATKLLGEVPAEIDALPFGEKFTTLPPAMVPKKVYEVIKAQNAHVSDSPIGKEVKEHWHHFTEDFLEALACLNFFRMIERTLDFAVEMLNLPLHVGCVGLNGAPFQNKYVSMSAGTATEMATDLNYTDGHSHDRGVLSELLFLPLTIVLAVLGVLAALWDAMFSGSLSESFAKMFAPHAHDHDHEQGCGHNHDHAQHEENAHGQEGCLDVPAESSVSCTKIPTVECQTTEVSRSKFAKYMELPVAWDNRIIPFAENKTTAPANAKWQKWMEQETITRCQLEIERREEREGPGFIFADPSVTQDKIQVLRDVQTTVSPLAPAAATQEEAHLTAKIDSIRHGGKAASVTTHRLVGSRFFKKISQLPIQTASEQFLTDLSQNAQGISSFGKTGG